MRVPSNNGVLVVLADCTDPTEEADFNRWYDHVHLPDMVESGPLSAASRFIRVDPEGAGDGKYLTVYESDVADIASVRAEVDALITKLVRGGRIHGALKMRFIGWYRRLDDGSSARSAATAPRGLLTIESDCSDATESASYERWYKSIHIPDVVGTGLYHSGYLFDAVDDAEGVGRYLAVYESDEENMAAVDQEVAANFVPKWVDSGHMSPLMKRTRRGLFRAA